MKLPKLQTKLQEFSNIKCTLKLSYATRDFYTELLLKWDRAAWAEGIKVSDRDLMFAIGTSDWKVITRAKNQLRKCQLIYFIANKGVPTQYFLTESAYQTAVDSAEVTAVHSAVHSAVLNTAPTTSQPTAVQSADHSAVQSAVFSTVVFNASDVKIKEKALENQTDENFIEVLTPDFIEVEKEDVPIINLKSITNNTRIDRDKRGECKGERKEKDQTTTTWRTNYEKYLEEANQAKDDLTNDSEFIAEREKYYPFCDVQLSIEKVFAEFWATPDGWDNKKSKTAKAINWRRTIMNNLSEKRNRINKQNNNNGNFTNTNQTSIGNYQSGRTTNRANADQRRAERGAFADLAEAILTSNPPEEV